MKLSVIIPVYNGEKYLNDTLEKISSQNADDVEIILVNDGSKDKSGSICDEFAKNDKRFKVYHKENGGVSTARNLGLDKATGDFVAFVDSDDFVTSNYLASLKFFAFQNYDLYSFNVIRKTNEELMLYGKILEECHSDNPFELMLSLFASFDFFSGSPINKLFKRSIIEKNKLRFDESLTICEDMLFNFNYIKHCKNMMHTNSALYIYVLNPESLTRNRKPVYVENKGRMYFEIKSEIEKSEDYKQKYMPLLNESYISEFAKEIERLKKQKTKKKVIKNTIKDSKACQELLKVKVKGFKNKNAKRQIKFANKGMWICYSFAKFNMFVYKVFAFLFKTFQAKVLHKN